MHEEYFAIIGIMCLLSPDRGENLSLRDRQQLDRLQVSHKFNSSGPRETLRGPLLIFSQIWETRVKIKFSETNLLFQRIF